MHARISTPVKLIRLCQVNIPLAQNVRSISRTPLNLPRDDVADLERVWMGVRGQVTTVGRHEMPPSYFQDLRQQAMPASAPRAEYDPSRAVHFYTVLFLNASRTPV